MSRRLSNLRSRAFTLQKGKCFYCGLPMWAGSPITFCSEYAVTVGQAAQFECTAEHLEPKSGGGRDSTSNIVAACRHCNATRHRRKEPLAPEKWQSIQHNRADSRWPSNRR